MASYLITGASRGFGLALAHELAALPASDVTKIFATARGDAPALAELVKKSPGRVVFVQLDVTNEASIKKAAAEVEANLAGKGLDVLINNAGVCQYAADGVQSMWLALHPKRQEIYPLTFLGTISQRVSPSTSSACTG